jgi:hypothetical protein
LAVRAFWYLNTRQIRYPPSAQNGRANRGAPIEVPRKSSAKPTNDRRRVMAAATTTPESRTRAPPSR